MTYSALKDAYEHLAAMLVRRGWRRERHWFYPPGGADTPRSLPHAIERECTGAVIRRRQTRSTMKKLLLIFMFAWPALAYAQLPIDPATQAPFPDLTANCPTNIRPGETQLHASGTLDATCIGIPNGSTLRIKPAAGVTARLSTGTVLCYPGGTIDVDGTAANSVIDWGWKNITPIDAGNYGTGLVAINCTIRWRGQSIPYAIRTAREVNAGDTTVLLSAPVPTSWVIGGQAHIGDTREHPEDFFPQSTRCVIKDYSGSTITCAQPFAAPALGAMNAARVVEKYPHFLYLTRNIRFHSEETSGTFAHILIFGNAPTEIRDTEFYNCGRRNPSGARLGRYCGPHLHHKHGGFTIADNSVHDVHGWGLTIHHSNDGLIQRNLCVNAVEWCITTEDGSERNNLFDANIALGPRDGSCFWGQGPSNRFTNNVAYNCLIGYDFRGSDTGTKSMQPLLQFDGNEAWSNRNDFHLWESFPVERQFIRRFYSVNNTRQSIYLYSVTRVTLEDVTCLGDPRRGHGEHHIALCVWWGDYPQTDNVIDRMRAENRYAGTWLPYAMSQSWRDPQQREPNVVTVQNSTFANNRIDIRFQDVLSAGQVLLPEWRVVLRNNKHSTSMTHVGWWHIVINPRGPITIQVEDFNGNPNDDFRVYNEETAPANATVRDRVEAKIVGGLANPPPPPPDPDGDGVPNDGTDKCPTVKGNSPSGCLVIPNPDPIGQVTTSTVTCPATPANEPDGQVYACSSVEGPNWDIARWGSATNAFNVVVKPGTGPLPVTLVLHGANVQVPGTFVNSNAPGIYIHPVDADPNPATGKSSSRWMGFKDAAGIFQPVTMERIVRYVQWVLAETTRWTADPNRVYVLGGSMGGGGAQKVALLNPSVFAAGVAATGWIDLAAWSPSGSECAAGVKWRTADGPECTQMLDTVHLVNTATGRKVPLFLTWNSNDGIVNPSRYSELLASLEARQHPYRAKWLTLDHGFHIIEGDPQLAIRLDVPVSVTTPSGSSPTSATGERTNLGSGTPPPPDADGDGVPDSSDKCPGTPTGTPVDAAGCPVTGQQPPPFVLEKTGASRDMAQPQRVTCPSAPPCDGPSDPEFKITFPSAVTLTRLQLTAPDGGWDTNPPNWLLAVTASPTTGLLNPTGATLNATGTVFYAYAAEGGIPRFPTGATVTVTATTAGGSVTQSMVVGSSDPPPPPPPDADNDKVPDSSDKCPNTPFGLPVNADGCALVQLDSDQDGVNDANDKCPNTSPGVKVGADGCALPPTNVCVTDPLTVTRIAWPSDNTGRRSLTFDVGSKRWATFTFTWPGTLTVTDTRGCTVTVNR